LRYLKRRQITGRVVFNLVKIKPDLREAPKIRNVSGHWEAPISKRISMLSSSKFNFLNAEYEISAPSDWNFRGLPKLWLYNLHYFDDLNAQGAPHRRYWHINILERWVNENRPGSGSGWESYPISIRTVNWVKFSLGGYTFNGKINNSLAVQFRYLMKRLEWHLLGNHLFSNAKALIFGGCYFHGDEAKSWLENGMAILEKEVPEQILGDGGHFERSPMYHALALEDLLDLLNLANTFPDAFIPWERAVSSWSETIKRMGGWLMTMAHPDGEISFFNDAAIGIAASPPELYSYCDRLGIRLDEYKSTVRYLDDSGYIRVEIGAAVLIVDVARIGPDYLPGHAHADTLSYELSLNGRRVLVNSGTSRYGLGPEREWQRSTGAHNTIEIDGQSSSEVWGGFRVARRAYPLGISVRRFGSVVVVEAGQDGYTRLPGRPIHWRRWTIGANQLEVYDRIEGGFSQAISRVYLHPDAQIETSGTNGRICYLDGCVYWNSTFNDIEIEGAVWHPGFGVSVGNKCLKMMLSPSDNSAEGRFFIHWP
jgi:uncharacterized heparinase superfamily protein